MTTIHTSNSKHSSAEFADNVVLVTGAGKGLGKSYALLLADRGAKVIVNNRRHIDTPGVSSADQVVEEIRQRGGTAIANYHSVESPASGQRMVEQAIATFGRLDSVIANAGVEEACSFHQQSIENFKHIFAINFFGSLHIAHAAFKVMRAAGYGRIVFSTSGAGLYGNHGMASYSSSKAALVGLTRALSIEGASKGIMVNAIAPYASTPMTDKYMPDAIKSQLAPEYVAPIAAYLASEHCRHNGETIVTAANRVRRAHMVENDSVLINASRDYTTAAVADAVDRAMDMSHARTMDNANAAFADLIR